MTHKTDFDYQHIAVRDFMEAGGQFVPEFVFLPPILVRELRAKLIMEEAVESANALGFQVIVNRFGEVVLTNDREPNIVQISDGCADLKVVTVGTEIACGINGRPVFEEVMRSNMTKDFTGAKRGDGKILKGPTYEPPNIEKVLQLQGWKP